MYDVHWLDAAYHDLIFIWVEAEPGLRAKIRDIYDQINQRLAIDPEAIGESRETNMRIDHMPPVGYRFQVDSVNKVVSVTKVWRF